MAYQPETGTFEVGIHQLEVTDPVQGGAGGVSNLPLLQLASRTNWLKTAADAASSALGLKAPLDSPAITGSPTAPTPAIGDDDTSLANTTFVQTAAGGLVSVSVAGSSNVTLTAVQWGAKTIVLTGALTGNINVIFPSRNDEWNVVNGTSGAFTITCKTAAGTGIVVAQSKARTLYCDSTNVYAGQTDLTDAALLGNPTAPTASTADSDTTVANTAFVQAAIAAGIAATLAVPSGSIIAGGWATAPGGYLECNGQVISRTTYSNLFTAIGTAYGAGNGSTTFNVPDLRAEFLRGWDNGRGIDAARALGSAQADEIKAHTHDIPVRTNANSGTGYVEDADSSGSATTVAVSYTGGSETRPRNVAVMFAIKV